MCPLASGGKEKPGLDRVNLLLFSKLLVCSKWPWLVLWEREKKLWRPSDGGDLLSSAWRWKLSVSRWGGCLACVVSGDSGVLVNWRWYACTWLLVLSSVACLSHSYKSGDHERRWATEAQLMRRDIVETSMSWAESDTGRLVAAISEEGELACLCLWFRRWSVS